MREKRSEVRGQRSEARFLHVSTRPVRLASSRPYYRIHRRAFSLIELIVVIGIVLALAALTVGVSVSLARKSETRDVENVFKVLDAAVTQWQTISDRQITYGTDGGGLKYEIQEDPADTPPTVNGKPDGYRTRYLLQILSRNTEAKGILAGIDNKFLNEDTAPPSPPPVPPRLRLIDSWDKEIVVVFPGRRWLTSDPPADKDADGTLRTSFEKVYGICINKLTRFVSAGPDRKFGVVAPATQLPDAQASDNIYSNPLLKKP